MTGTFKFEIEGPHVFRGHNGNSVSWDKRRIGWQVYRSGGHLGGLHTHLVDALVEMNKYESTVTAQLQQLSRSYPG